MGTENKESCSQRDSAERKGYVRAHRSFNRIWKERDSAEPDILGKILDKDNLNRAYKRVKANKGAPGIDGMTIEAALLWLKEHNCELTERIRRGKYTPSPVRRVEIPKPDGGIRKLGIPTVIDRIIQQAMLQQLMPIYESLFSEDSFGYRPGRGAKDAILRIKEYMEQGYTRAVVLDLSKYFDTLNHTVLLNLLRKQVKDERVIQMVKRYLKSGVMENGVVTETEEGSPQGGNLSPLLANVYLNEPELPKDMEPMVYVNFCEESNLMNPRCQKLSDLDSKTVEQDKAWYADRNPQNGEPTMTAKLFFTVYYAEKDDQVLQSFKGEINIGSGNGGIISQLKMQNEMKLTDESWISYQKNKGNEEFQKYMEDLTDMQNHVLPYLQSFCSLEESGVKERREQQVAERNEGRVTAPRAEVKANEVVKDIAKADNKPGQQKQTATGKDKKLSIHERLEISKRIIQEKQGKDKQERGADLGVRTV